jgi:cysteine desulfurase
MNESKRIYLDNAATSRVSEEVLDVMLPYLTGLYGNPSSVHYYGRTARIAVEEARKTIARLLNVKPANVIFTSGATESNNMIIAGCISDLKCNHIITSPLEHHAVLHSGQHYSSQYNISLSYVHFNADGSIDQNNLIKQLELRAANESKCLVSLMHANNETGLLTDIETISHLCKQTDAVFHSDCVQTIGHYPLDLQALGVDFASASAHKFHGPKGVGFLYVREGLQLSPMIYGGSQEKGFRAGTENVASIVGMAKALQLCYQNFKKDQQYISGLKDYFCNQLKENFAGILINSGNFSLYSVLSVSFPKTDRTEFLILNLDQKGICVSGGSACSEGDSHVMRYLKRADHYTTLRFSFSKYNTFEEINQVISILKEILEPVSVSYL